jgi:hypothetical protein
VLSSLRGRLRRHTVAVIAVAGIFLGTAAGFAYAGAHSEHTSGLWHHGIDGDHVFMTRTDGGSSEGVVAWIYNKQVCPGCGWLTDQHSYETSYVANHIHVDGCNAWDCVTTAGHISSPGPYLAHHSHP